MFWMAALIEEGLVGLLAGEDSDENIGLMMLPEVTAYAALTVVNCLHRNLRVRFVGLRG